MNNIIDLTQSSSDEEYQSPQQVARRYATGAGYTGSNAAGQGHGYPTGSSEVRRASATFPLPSVAQDVAAPPSADYGFPPPPQQELNSVRSRRAPLASTPRERFDAITGGRLPSPPPQHSPTVLGAASENRFSRNLNIPSRPHHAKSPASPSAQLRSETSPQRNHHHHSAPRLLADGVTNGGVLAINSNGSSTLPTPRAKHTTSPKIAETSKSPDERKAPMTPAKMDNVNLKALPKTGSPSKPAQSPPKQRAEQAPPTVQKSPVFSPPKQVQSLHLNEALHSPTTIPSPESKVLDSRSLGGRKTPNEEVDARPFRPAGRAPKTRLGTKPATSLSVQTPNREVDAQPIPQYGRAPKILLETKPATSLRVQNPNTTESSFAISPDAFQKYLRAFIKVIRSEHEYHVKSRLAQARCLGAANDPSSLELLGESSAVGSKRSRFIQEVSPFADMKPLQPEPSKLQRASPKVGKLCQYLPKVPKPGNEVAQSFRWDIYQLPNNPVPAYSNYIPTSRNILVGDVKHRTFLPYMGDDYKPDDDHFALELTIEKNQARYHRMNALAEKIKYFLPYVEDMLQDLGCDVESVLQYLLIEKKPVPLELPREFESIWKNREAHLQDGYYKDSDDSDSDGDWEQVSEKKVQRQWKEASKHVRQNTSGRKMAAASIACHAFLAVTGFSLWQVVKSTETAQAIASGKFRVDLEENTHAKGHRNSTSKNKTPNTYVALGCLVCKGHECPGHGKYEDEGGRRNIRSRVTHKPCSPRLAEDEIADSDSSQEPLESVRPKLEALVGLNEDKTVSGISFGLLGDGGVGFTDQDVCSDDCFWLKTNRKQIAAKRWSEQDRVAFEALRPAYKDDLRGACMLAKSGLIDKTCTEIFYKLLAPEPETVPTTWRKENDALVPVNEKKIVRQQLDQLLKFGTHMHHERRPFAPCNHSGKCDELSDCDCFRSGVTCEKSCACASSCRRRYRGCVCPRKGKICWQNDRCDCFRLNRECDPDLCRTCGIHEVLDPANRHRDDVLRGKCANGSIQRGVPKRTLLGTSALLASGGVSGWGLYMGMPCKKFDYIGEYVGEIISRNEAEERGTIYDRMNLNYLFDLNKSQTLDSTLFGNKLRFINHEDIRLVNVAARPMFCNTVQRIGMFATKDIAIGEEMFFDYGPSFAAKLNLITRRNKATDITATSDMDDMQTRPVSRGIRGRSSASTTKRGRKVGRPPKQGSASAGSIRRSISAATSMRRGSSAGQAEPPRTGQKRRRSETKLSSPANEEGAAARMNNKNSNKRVETERGRRRYRGDNPIQPADADVDVGELANDENSDYETPIKLPGRRRLLTSPKRPTRPMTPRSTTTTMMAGDTNTLAPTTRSASSASAQHFDGAGSGGAGGVAAAAERISRSQLQSSRKRAGAP